MKKTLIPLVAGFAILLAACSGVKKGEGEGGLLYEIVEDESTPEVGEVAFVSVSYIEATESGRVLAQTGQLDPRPSFLFARLPEFKGDFQDALQYLSEGDSAVIRIRIDSLKSKRNLRLPASDTSGYMVYHVRINKVINRQGAVDTTYPARIEAYKTEQLALHRNGEQQKIKNYLKHKNLSYVATGSGLLVPASLKTVMNNPDTPVAVNYTLSSLDGKVFDTNVEGLALHSGVYSPAEVYGPRRMTRRSALFPGLGEAISLLPKGTKATFIVPSRLAYGDRGSNKTIPDYSPLLCEIELLTN